MARLNTSKRVKLDVTALQQAGESRFSGKLNFVIGCCAEEGNWLLMVERVELHFHPPVGYFSRLNKEWQYCLQVLLTQLERGQLSSVDDFLQLCDQIVDKEHKVCPSIDPEV